VGLNATVTGASAASNGLVVTCRTQLAATSTTAVGLFSPAPPSPVPAAAGSNGAAMARLLGLTSPAGAVTWSTPVRGTWEASRNSLARQLSVAGSPALPPVALTALAADGSSVYATGNAGGSLAGTPTLRVGYDSALLVAQLPLQLQEQQQQPRRPIL
jgi:hypothetical protein